MSRKKFEITKKGRNTIGKRVANYLCVFATLRELFF
jgi:hypothetical protein